MAKTDIIKFRELLLTDTDFQEKLRKAAEEYKGEKDEKSLFENLLLPLAKERGLTATYDEFREYMGAFANAEGEISEDELAQVAAGKGNITAEGVFVCFFLGLGVGATAVNSAGIIKDYCPIIGQAIAACVGPGATARH